MLRHLNLLAGFLTRIGGYRDDLVAFLCFCHFLDLHWMRCHVTATPCARSRNKGSNVKFPLPRIGKVSPLPLRGSGLGRGPSERLA